MAGATSLVELILKKWGDDIAGAAKELEEKVGFPESVANRIATGELPMDEASRVARREAKYADEGLVHVNRGGIEGEGFDNSRLPTDDPDTPFNAHWFTTDPHPSTAFRKQGSDDPLTYTPVVLEKGRRGDWRDVVKYGESMGEDAGYGTEFREGLLNNGVSDIVVRGGDKIDQSTIDALPVGGRLKVDPDNKYGDRRNSLVKNDDGSLGFYEGSEHILDYDDLADYQRFNPEIQDVAVLDNTIIRSPNAAFDPEYTGPNIMGGAALPLAAGLLAAGQSDDADAGFITKGGKTLLEAWHGSPHKFDKFSMDAIGTGEGAQAYGHGLYFADEIDVAKGYQPRDRDNEQWMYEQYKAAEEAGDQYMMDAWERAMMHDSPIELRASAADPDYDEYSQAAFAEVAEALEANPGAGSLSRVEVDVTPESLLDWDKPLSEQSEAVRNIAGPFIDRLRGYGWDSPEAKKTGADLYSHLTVSNPKASSELASKALSDRGIKGIKYLDGDSRAVGDGTSNYVIFDDSLINIAERGNADPRLLAGTAAGTAGLLAAGQSDDADASVSSLAKRGLDLVSPDGKMFSVLEKGPDVGPRREVAYAEMGSDLDGGLSARDMAVTSDYRGNGLMGETYDAIEEVTGKNITPSNWLTDDGAKFWVKRDRQLIEDMYNDGQFDWDDGFEDKVGRALERGNADPRLLAGVTGMAAAGLAAPVLMGERGQPTTPEERGFKSWEEVSRDPTAPLPAPTWGEAMGKAGSNIMYLLGLPMTGLQGLARGGYGLLTGEDLTEAAAQAGNTMDVGWRNGLLDVSQMNPDKGADQAEAYVTKKTGDESLGWMAKMGLLLGGI